MNSVFSSRARSILSRTLSIFSNNTWGDKVVDDDLYDDWEDTAVTVDGRTSGVVIDKSPSYLSWSSPFSLSCFSPTGVFTNPSSPIFLYSGPLTGPSSPIFLSVGLEPSRSSVFSSNLSSPICLSLGLSTNPTSPIFLSLGLSTNPTSPIFYF